MIALILGGGPDVWKDAEAAAALLNRRHVVVAANKAIEAFQGRLDGAATLHSDLLAGWIAARTGNKDFRSFVAAPHASCPRAEVVAERWPGSSGLYAAQVALTEMGATAAILCGVPMQSSAGHFIDPGAWAGTGDYRQAFAAALPLWGGRLRSAGGWTAELFGRPSAAWIEAVDNIQALGATAPERPETMINLKNTTDGTRSFWARGVDGNDTRVHLQPGEGGRFDVNRDDVTITDLIEGGKRTPAAKAPTTEANPAPKPRKPPAAVTPPAAPATPEPEQDPGQ